MEEALLGVDSKWTVTFSGNGIGPAPDPITDVADNTLIEEPIAPFTQGYNFEGWYKEAECINQWFFGADKVTGNVTLYAKWRALTGKDPHYSIDVGQEITVDLPHIDSTYTDIEYTVKNEQVAECWVEDGQCTITGKEYGNTQVIINYLDGGRKVDTRTINVPVTMVGQPYEVYFRANFEGSDAAISERSSGGNSVPVPDVSGLEEFIREDYEFIGWSHDPDEEAQGNEYLTPGDYVSITVDDIDKAEDYFAMWRPKGTTYTISFDANGETCEDLPESITGVRPGSSLFDVVEAGTEGKIPTGNKEFTGWFLDAECTTPYVEMQMIRADVTLYAGWEGNVATGWVQDDIGWKYVDGDKTFANMWIANGNAKWYVGEDGYALKDALIKDESGNIYYVGSNYAMVTGKWVDVAGDDEDKRLWGADTRRYCFEADGKAVCGKSVVFGNNT